MYVNTKLGVHVTPVGAVLWEHRAGVKSNTRGVNFNTTVFAVYLRSKINGQKLSRITPNNEIA